MDLTDANWVGQKRNFLGNISGSFSERLQVSIYPTYVDGKELTSNTANDQPITSEEDFDGFSPRQAWITEIGIDLTERINFSIQASPNREDIPPQGTLTYQFNPNLEILGSLDRDGNWQSELQIFVRY